MVLCLCRVWTELETSARDAGSSRSCRKAQDLLSGRALHVRDRGTWLSYGCKILAGGKGPRASPGRAGGTSLLGKEGWSLRMSNQRMDVSLQFVNHQREVRTQPGSRTK